MGIWIYGEKLEACPSCGKALVQVEYDFQWCQTCDHDSKPNGTGLDDGPPLNAERKKPAPKSIDEMKSIRARAWSTRRAMYGKRGHR